MKKAVLLLLISTLCIGRNQANTVKIAVADFSFTPSNFTCSVGDTIRFTWQNGSHNTSSLTVPTGADTWNSDITSASQTFDYVPQVIGDYTFHCSVHPTLMTGSFTVTLASGISPVKDENAGLQIVSPASHQVQVTFSLPTSKNVSVGLYDLTGKFIAQLMDAPVSSGEQRLTLPIKQDVSSGLYILKFQIGDLVLNKKLVIRR